MSLTMFMYYLGQRMLLLALMLSLTPVIPSLLGFSTSQSQFTIMLDPAGDAQNAGRTIEDSFERSLTIQCAEAIKHDLESKYSQITVVLTRLPGETIQPLQNANFANRLNVDLYVSLHFYLEPNHKAELAIFSLSYGDDIFGISQSEHLSFLPVDQAHKKGTSQSLRYSQIVHETLKKDPRSASLCIHEVIRCPFKPLMGIIVPALGIELGLRQKNDWAMYVACISDALVELIQHGKRS